MNYFSASLLAMAAAAILGFLVVPAISKKVNKTPAPVSKFAWALLGAVSALFGSAILVASMVFLGFWVYQDVGVKYGTVYLIGFTIAVRAVYLIEKRIKSKKHPG